ncbi:DUF4198 domain-containing protein [Acidimangrovimonas pyrenivorans]|uniref:DUF4198 domain-containing protein n=1 Tax=Acidimangrovimonas pyrenivorans TaxID=2030798 RepID=A0ABV7AJR0_9RHOB
MKLPSLLATGVLALLPALAPLPARAHFQLLFSPETMIEHPGDVAVGLIFWHPFENGQAMNMAKPEQFFAINRGKRIDLEATLTPRRFRGAENAADAWQGSVPVKRAGDYVLVTVPAPYYEETEEIYIQQIAKSFLNRGAFPTDWNKPVGLPAEIVPLDKPYNIPAGATFTGRVLSAGKPVAGAEIEVEYLAAAPDLKAFATTEPTTAPLPGGALVVTSDENGYFTFGVPRAGFWGFAALGVGPQRRFKGKELSQDAVIWIRAWDMK